MDVKIIQIKQICLLKYIKQNKAVTLIALVITIIILLILAGITINLILRQEGIMNVAQQAGKNYTESEENEKLTLEEYENKILGYRDINQSISNSNSNPKQLISLQLSSSAENERAVGTYYASTTFTKTPTENYDKYLEQNEEGKWKVLKSGYYMIVNETAASYNASNYSASRNYSIINGTAIEVHPYMDNLCKQQRFILKKNQL